MQSVVTKMLTLIRRVPIFVRMTRKNGAAHVVTTTRRYKGKTYRTHLLRRSYREDGKVKNETLGNLSHLPDHVIELVRGSLKGEHFVPATDVFDVIESPQHGHVQAVLTAMRRLGFQNLIGSRPCRERDLVVAMVAARILEPDSKLATTRWWHTTTLPDLAGVADAEEDDLYAAMDWLFERQDTIEKKLAARHLHEGSTVLYDLTSSYFEGATCPLAALGHNRDGKKGKLQVNYGLLTDDRGCPVSVSVFPGNTSDTKTLLPQVQKVRSSFGIKTMILVGDRGMISQKLIEGELRDMDGVEWITALKGDSIRKLIGGENMQLGLFDDRNLFEFSDLSYPGERLVACRNTELAKRRSHKRQSLLDATRKELTKIRDMVARAKLSAQKASEAKTKRKTATPSSGKRKRPAIVGKDNIGVRVGKIVNKYKVAKHFVLEIGDDSFDFRINEAAVAAEAALDGIYVVRTSVSTECLGTEDVVRSYKRLSQVERAFRSIKTLDLLVRPIRHRLEQRVRAHIFLCMLAYYVDWHMREAWRPLLFADENQDAKKSRDPVAAATRSEEALRKVHSKTLDDGSDVHSFQTLLRELSGVVRNVCQRRGAPQDEPTFQMTTIPNDKQRHALELLETINT